MISGGVSLVIDPSSKRIHLARGEARTTLRGKSVQFVLTLLITDPSRFFTRDELHRLSSWRGMAAISVGKQAARIVDALTRAGFPIIEWEHKTTAWRLSASLLDSVPVETVSRARDLLAFEDRLNMLRFNTASATLVARWLAACGSALVDMTQGLPEAGYKKLRHAYGLIDHDGISAISDVLATRIGQALPKPHLPVPTSSPSSTFVAAANARRMAAYARASPSHEWEQQYNQLHKILAVMVVSGDIATQAILFNALAVLARRLGRMEEALDYVREAAALALFSGDLILIQNISFNFGNILSGFARSNPEHFSNEDFLVVLGLDIEIRTRLNIGQDSAQAELLSAYLRYDMGDFDEARAQLRNAATIIAISRQRTDVALYDRVDGLLRCASNFPDSDGFAQGMEALIASARTYREIGNEVAASEVDQDISDWSARVGSTK